jgi:hypothetical protein
VVATEGGAVRGVDRGSTRAYFGVPFATVGRTGGKVIFTRPWGDACIVSFL